MKKIMLFMLMLAIVIGLYACNSEISPNKQSKTEEKQNSDNKNILYYENEVFKEVSIKVTEDDVKIIGKARVFEGVFQYSLLTEDSEVLITDYYQTEGAPSWGKFEIILDKELTTNEGAKVELFVYSANDGSKINVLQIPID
jgi:hypothetical protein